MEIRAATEQDIPNIVDLLKQTLGETLLPKSEDYWRWKHLKNPFGASPVLLALDSNEIIGVRAFMTWQWIERKQIYRAVRAVDTATHAHHQGKGVFKKLTLALVDFCKNKGDHFVFNTPNQQSKPGYLKMGWQEAGKLPIHLSIDRPFGLVKNLLVKGRTLKVENSPIKYYLDHPDLTSLTENHLYQTQNLTTNISRAYLKWRYLEVPVANYVAIGEEEGHELTGLILARIKQGRMGMELRITDLFLKMNYPRKGLLKQLEAKKKEWGIDYCTLSGTLSEHSKQLLGRLKLSASVGPIVTIRDLCLADLSGLQNFNKWSPSLGDLELF